MLLQVENIMFLIVPVIESDFKSLVTVNDCLEVFEAYFQIVSMAHRFVLNLRHY